MTEVSHISKHRDYTLTYIPTLVRECHSMKNHQGKFLTLWTNEFPQTFSADFTSLKYSIHYF